MMWDVVHRYMSRAVAILVLLGIVVLNASSSIAVDAVVSITPAGFSRIDVAELDLTVLVPEGWHYVNNQGKLLPSFAVVKQMPTVGKRFRTGLSVYAIDHLGKSDGGTLARQIKEFVRRIAAKPDQQIASVETVQFRSFVGQALRYLDNTGAEPRMIYQAYLADEAIDRLLVVSFESPSLEWDENWLQAAVMLDAMFAEDM